MILFGLAEVATGFTHNFLGLITTTNGALATYGAAGIGALYAVGGLLILTARKWGESLALLCLAVVIVEPRELASCHKNSLSTRICETLL